MPSAEGVRGERNKEDYPAQRVPVSLRVRSRSFISESQKRRAGSFAATAVWNSCFIGRKPTDIRIICSVTGTRKVASDRARREVPASVRCAVQGSRGPTEGEKSERREKRT